MFYLLSFSPPNVTESVFCAQSLTLMFSPAFCPSSHVRYSNILAVMRAVSSPSWLLYFRTEVVISSGHQSEV